MTNATGAHQESATCVRLTAPRPGTVAMRLEQVSDFWHSQIAGGRQRIRPACALD